jgi:3-hydroxyisobutyrate dehydrogenase-like beta-hydroxyacid dehydrogenase
VASLARTVFLSLPTPAVVQAVALGDNGVGAGSAVRIVIDASTTGPGVAAQVARALAERGITYVDSPVSGGIAGATKGTLAVMVACPKATYDEVQPILQNFGKLFYTGEKAGLAQTAKLANNLLAAAALVVSSEAVVMGVKAGLDPKVLIDIINAGSGRNSATQDKFPRSVLPRTFDFGFATGLSYKDVRLCVDEAEALGVPMVVGAAVRQMLAVTQARFGAASDFTCIAKVVEEWAGVEIRG